jgi:hypothetical protein
MQENRSERGGCRKVGEKDARLKWMNTNHDKKASTEMNNLQRGQNLIPHENKLTFFKLVRTNKLNTGKPSAPYF